MIKVRMRLTGVLIAGCAISLISCTQQTPQEGAQATPSTQTAPATQATPWPQTATPNSAPIAPTGLGSSQFKENPEVRCDLLEIKRVSGNALMVRWRVVNTGAAKVSFDFQWEDLYFIDPAENKRYSYLTDSEGKKILDTKWGAMQPNEQWLSWAKFPAPPPTSTKISVSIGGFAPFEDVPITP